MICPVCKKEIPDGAEFCPICGANLKQDNAINNGVQTAVTNEVPQVEQQTIVENNTQVENVIQPVETTQSQQTSIPIATPIEKTVENNVEKKSNNKIVIIAIVIVLIIVAVVLVLSLTKTKKTNDNPTTTTATTTTNDLDCFTAKYSYSYNESGDLLIDITHMFDWDEKKLYLTAIIKKGVANVGDSVQIIGLDKEIVNTTIESIKIKDSEVNSAKAGDEIDIKLKDVDTSSLEDVQSIIKPDSYKTSKSFEGKVYFFTKDEGGRHTAIYSSYKPLVQFRTSNVNCYYRSHGTTVLSLELPEGVEEVNPGDEINIKVDVMNSAIINEGDTFTFIEGGRPVAQGIVNKVIE